MKKWLLTLSLISSVAITSAQDTSDDTLFRFNHRISRCENYWIAFPKQADIDAYPFGFVYIDPASGFIFNLEGYFKNSGGKFTRIVKTIDANDRERYVLKPGIKTQVAIIGSDHNVDLDIYPRPDWLKIYNSYTDTLAHNVQWGRAYNSIHDSQMALIYLEQTYHVAPHTEGVEIELAHAYNAVKRFDDAIKVAEAGLRNNVSEASLYKELGNGYLSKGLADRALEEYNSGMKLCDPTEMDIKSEMAMNTAKAYLSKNNKEGYAQWMQYASVWAPRNSEIAATIADMQ
jgi:tetratricopeptide (TPR) repeat protein